MAYDILSFREIGYRTKRGNGLIEFTSKTRVGLNEEIDRFMMEKELVSLKAVSRELVPEYSQRTEKGEPRWRLTMWAVGMVED